MKKIILGVAAIASAFSVLFIVSQHESSEKQLPIETEQQDSQKDTLSNSLSNQLNTTQYSADGNSNNNDVNTNSQHMEKEQQVELTTHEKFEIEEVDYNWSYDYENTIRDSLYQTLDADFINIELLECRTTICKLKISPSENTANFKQTTANSLSIISKSDWNKGNVKLHRLLPSSKQAFAELYITK